MKTSALHAIIFGILVAVSPLAVAKTYVLGVVPQQSAKKLAAKWSPVLRLLSERSGHRIVFSTAKSIPEFEKRLAGGVYDFAYMNPYHYTVFSQAPGYKAFAKQKNKKIKGIVVVKKDSPITAIDQLAGNQLAFPSPAAFAASVLPRAHFKSIGVTISQKYVRSHDSVYLAVAKGLFPAGGGVMRTFKNTTPEVRDQLRILWTTQAYTPHAFAAHPEVDSQVVRDLSAGLLAMNDDPVGRQLLDSISFNGMERATDADWDDVRALGIRLLDELIKD